MKLQEKMYLLVEEYQQSGRSQKEFCNQQGISLAKLNYWIRKYGQRQPSAGFIKVETKLTDEQAELEICYPNGVRLKATGADLSLLGQLIRLY